MEADSGAIGGTDTHEFMVICDDVGEADIAHCDNCGYAANVEKAISAFTPGPKVVVEEGSPRVVDTPEKRTITEVADFLSVPVTHLIKALVYIAGDRPVMAVVRGDHEVNEVKLARHLEVLEVELADSSVVEQVTGAPVGFGGPINLPEEIPVIVDREVMELRDAVCGANSLDQHYVGVEPWRDFPQVEVADIRMVTAGDPCPKCNAPLSVAPGIEVGQVFKLGTKYSQAMNATYLDESGKEQPLVMGCYGIGVSRTLAAVIEKHHDDDGIIWPVSIAPYHVIVVPVNWKDAEQKTTAEELYQRMQELGIEVILDDRDERPGVKFKDADLIGIPIRIVVGRSVKDGKVGQAALGGEGGVVELSAVIDKVSEIVHTAR